MRAARWASAGGALILGVAGLTACEPERWSSELVTVNAAGTASGNGTTQVLHRFSADGTRIGFTSTASDLGPPDGDRPWDDDVYVRDLQTGTTTLVSENAAGTGSGNGPSRFIDISPDGTRVLFQSDASDLGPQDTNGRSDVYVRDLVAGTTTLVSINAAGTDSGNSSSDSPAFGRDASVVAFHSNANDLVDAPHEMGVSHVYLRDLDAGTTTLVSRPAPGLPPTGTSIQATVSPDGTKVAFTTTATTLGPADTDSAQDVYLYDVPTGSMTLVSTNAAGTGSAGGRSTEPEFSPDDRTLVFTSTAGDLGAADFNAWYDIYLHDIATGGNELVSVNGPGTRSSGGEYPAFSPDGTRIAFVSGATDLGPPGTPNVRNIYVRDLPSSTTLLVSAAADGTSAANAGAGAATFSSDGTRVAFASRASNLADDDNSTNYDVFVRDLRANRTSLVSANADRSGGGNYNSEDPRFSPTGDVAFLSYATDLGPSDHNTIRDLYIARPVTEP